MARSFLGGEFAGGEFAWWRGDWIPVWVASLLGGEVTGYRYSDLNIGNSQGFLKFDLCLG